MVNSNDFSKRLEKILDYYGLSATAFSDAIDFNRSTISHLLSGRNKPSLDFVMKVIQQFPEVELYWLLNGKGDFPSDKKNDPTPSAPSSRITASEMKEATKQSVSIPTKHPSETTSASAVIERIVIFYSDGTFKTYEN
ncbi:MULTISPECIES: helix-turn-helix transcriptional regulator [Altibacter]|uniref:helix-turn-helix domain-containing protein n=1 Tax=Altibacter TaxID=1535231 RepID=UPI00054F856F|nr:MULTISPECIES: helix-turn-helix transcriptional regulator [Altibacter]MCW8980599.1 helix-turn-helix domain-containing protein [Altibacter sp.]MCW9037084.1 helix-turn-helix domain-containing protein [Altibacter sp.]